MVFIDPQKSKTSVVALVALGKAKKKLGDLAKKSKFDKTQLKTVKKATDAVSTFYSLAAKKKHDEEKCKKACKKAKTALSAAGSLKLDGDISKTWPMEVSRYQKLLDGFPK